MRCDIYSEKFEEDKDKNDEEKLIDDSSDENEIGELRPMKGMTFNFIKPKNSTVHHNRLHAPTHKYFDPDHIGTGLDLIRE